MKKVLLPLLSVLCVAPALAFAAPEAAIEATYGPTPTLPAPEKSLIPTMNIAPVNRWSAGQKPVPAAGLRVDAYAAELSHPRWLYVLPNGDVLVAESDAPPKPEDGKGIKGFVMKKVMKKAGSGVPSANRITLLRDENGDGVVDKKSVFLEQLNSPIGMALIGDDFYVANTDAILRFPYKTGDLAITTPGVKFTDLPGGPLNHHWTKNIIASKDGKKIFATVGSNSNIAENGIEAEANRARIIEIDVATGEQRAFATGLRNPNGLAWEPVSGALWTTVNERDDLGNNLVPDYMTSVKDGGFYGWPYSYYGQHVDTRVKPQQPDRVSKALVPDYALGAHTASLGLAFYEAKGLSAHYNGGAFVGQHGSWNRKPHSGYKVVFIPFEDGKPAGVAEDILTGFLNDSGEAQGRPVGVAVDHTGALLVADDVGNVVWRVSSMNAQHP